MAASNPKLGLWVLTGAVLATTLNCSGDPVTGTMPGPLMQAAGAGSTMPAQAGMTSTSPMTMANGGSAGGSANGSGGSEPESAGGESSTAGSGMNPFSGGSGPGGRGADDEARGGSSVGGTSEMGGAGGAAGAGGESSVDTPDPAPSGDITGIAYCEPTLDWDSEWAAWENEVLEIVNEYRMTGANCDSEGMFGSADPLTMDANLQCAARVHSFDMYDRDFFDHTNPDGDAPNDRMDAAGYEGRSWGENIAYGQRSPREVVDGWIDSDGHCSNIMNPDYTLIGVGYYPGDPDSFQNANYWTQTFGR